MSVLTEERTRRRVAVAEALSHQLPRQDLSQIVARLDDGLSLLRNLLYTRLQADVQKFFGQDSMIMPLSLALTEQQAKGEIEAFVVAEVVDELSRPNVLPQAGKIASGCWTCGSPAGRTAPPWKAGRKATCGCQVAKGS